MDSSGYKVLLDVVARLYKEIDEKNSKIDDLEKQLNEVMDYNAQLRILGTKHIGVVR